MKFRLLLTDAFYMAVYKEKRNAKSVLALCFAEAAETYHHWRVFSHGCDGVCIEFNEEQLKGAINQHEQLEARPVEYKQINEISDADMSVEMLPFIKRYPYRDEGEFRVVYVDLNEAKEFEKVAVPLDCIERIILSPWMPAALATAVKDTLREIEGSAQFQIYRSTLIENERWKRAAKPDLQSA